MVKALLKNVQRKLQKHVKEGKLIQKPYVFLLSFLRPLYFSNETLILKGLKKKSKSKYPSIIFFSVHKSASTFIRHTILKLVAAQKLTLIRYTGLLPKKVQAEMFNNPQIMKKLLIQKGFFFSVFRNYYNFPNLEKFKIILVLRDPRDVLTSQYFSVLFNHPLSRKEVVENRKKYADHSIDEFVLEFAPELKQKYADYCTYLIGRDNVLFLRYEDMISNFRDWLYKLSSFLGVSGNDELINKLVAETSFKVKKENPHAFIRNIKAGDHLNKLKPETIEYLTNLFKPELLQLNYIAETTHA